MSTVDVIVLILGSTYTCVLHFGCYFSHKDEGRLICGLTYMRVYTVLQAVRIPLPLYS